MRNQSYCYLFALALVLTGAALPARADEVADKGRDIFKQHQHAVVTVQAVLKDILPRRRQDEREPAGPHRHGGRSLRSDRARPFGVRSQ